MQYLLPLIIGFYRFFTLNKFKNKIYNKQEYISFFNNYAKVINGVFNKTIEYNDNLILKKQETATKTRDKIIPFIKDIKGIMDKKKNTIIFFDLDGTLFDTSKTFLPALEKTFEYFDLSFNNDVKEDWADVVGKKYDALEEKIMKLEFNGSFESFLKILQYNENLFIEDSANFLYDDTSDVLSKLKAEGYQLGICTNARAGYWEDIAKRLDIYSYFQDELIIYPEKWKRVYNIDRNPAHKGEMLNSILAAKLPFKSFLVGDRLSDKNGAEHSNSFFVPVKSIFNDSQLIDDGNLCKSFMDIYNKINNEMNVV